MVGRRRSTPLSPSFTSVLLGQVALLTLFVLVTTVPSVYSQEAAQPPKSIEAHYSPVNSITYTPDGQIVAEFRRGYRIGSKLLRPAMVKVAKA